MIQMTEFREGSRREDVRIARDPMNEAVPFYGPIKPNKAGGHGAGKPAPGVSCSARQSCTAASTGSIDCPGKLEIGTWYRSHARPDEAQIRELLLQALRLRVVPRRLAATI